MVAIIILDMTMRYSDVFYFYVSGENISMLFKITLFLQNVDAGAAKELMAYLIKLQSSLSQVNQYVKILILKIPFFM